MKITPYYSGREAYNVVADDGKEYVYVPGEFLNKGFVQDGMQYYDPDFIRPGLLDNAAPVQLPANAAFSDQAKSLYQNPNKGYIWSKDDFNKINSDDFTFYSYPISKEFPAIEGLTKAEGQYTYKTGTQPGQQVTYLRGINPDGTTNFRSWKTEGGSSLLGKALGGWFDDLTSSIGLQQLAGDVNDFFNTDVGKAVKWASLASSLGNLATDAAAQEAGSETAGNAAAADNIDMGGGWNPATGVGDGATAGAAALAPAKELSAGEVSDMINAEQAQNMSAQEASDKIAEEQAANAGASGAAAAGGGLADYGLALAGAQAAAALGSSLLAPDMSGSGSSSFQAKEYKPDYNKKFDAPVEWADVPEWNFQMSNTPEPYLQQSQAGQFTGPALFDPSQPYASGLIQGLRAGSNAPSSQNLGFTLFSTAKP